VTKTSQKLACVTNTSKLLRPILGSFVIGSIAFFALGSGPKKKPKKESISGENCIPFGSLFGNFGGTEISNFVVEWTCDQYFQRTRLFKPNDASLGGKGRPRGHTRRHFRRHFEVLCKRCKLRLDRAGSIGLEVKPLVFVLGASWGPLVATLFPRRVPEHLPEGVLRVILGLLWRFQSIWGVLGRPFGITFRSFLEV
jgi:hypothetical protein